MKITFCIEKGDVITALFFFDYNVLPTFTDISLTRLPQDNISVTNEIQVI